MQCTRSSTKSANSGGVTAVRQLLSVWDMKTTLIALGVGSLLVACGSSAGSASVDGTVSGVSLSPSSASYLDLTNEIVISSNGDSCTDVQNDMKRKDSQDLIIGFGTSSLSPGTFAIDHATFETFDDVCNSPIDTTAATGTVTVTAVDQSGTLNITGAINSVTGTFDITFASGEHVTGSFAAESCSLSTLPNPQGCH